MPNVIINSSFIYLSDFPRGFGHVSLTFHRIPINLQGKHRSIFVREYFFVFIYSREKKIVPHYVDNYAWLFWQFWVIIFFYRFLFHCKRVAPGTKTSGELLIGNYLLLLYLITWWIISRTDILCQEAKVEFIYRKE